MTSIQQILLTALFAFIGTLWIHPKILKISIIKNLVDNPNARKLQRKPVPVMGGLAVFFGITIGLCISPTIFNSASTFMLISAMLIMLYIGTIDDIIDLSPAVRFLIEILIIVWLMYASKSSINCFWGLWGVDTIPNWVAYALTIFASVGIINAINLIDGVNGLSSGFCFMSSVLFAIFFYKSGNHVMATLATAAAGAIVPFFLHNVFGTETKMFIGDGGTLVIGTMMAMFVMSILHAEANCAPLVLKGFGLIPFTLAVLAIPVFDTLRVMSTRIINGRPPFDADKSHLHHLFIDLGFSHIGTTVSILSANFLIVALWYLSYKMGASIEAQLYIVIVLSILITFVFYWFAKRQIEHDTKCLKTLRRIGKMLNIEKKGIWTHVQKFVDRF